MKRAQMAIGVIGIAITLAAESPVCRRILLPKPHHSKATLAKWAEWNRTHIPPTPKQILHEIDLACPPVDLASIDVGGFLPQVELPVWTDEALEPDEQVAEIFVIAPNEIGLRTMPPFVYYGVVPQSVPEPSSIYLLLTGIGVCVTRKVRA